MLGRYSANNTKYAAFVQTTNNRPLPHLRDGKLTDELPEKITLRSNSSTHSWSPFVTLAYRVC